MTISTASTVEDYERENVHSASAASDLFKNKLVDIFQIYGINSYIKQREFINLLDRICGLWAP